MYVSSLNDVRMSLQKNRIGIILIIIASISTAFGQMFWKLSTGLVNLEFIIGFFLYFLGAIIMIIAFRFGSLSVLHPLLSIGYIFALLISIFFLNEILQIHHFIGTLLIVVGAVLIGGGDA